MSTFLFEDFEPSSQAAWKQKIQVDLKGEDYNEALLWHTKEDIVVRPFYTKEDRKSHAISLPREGFKIVQSLFIDDVSITNKLAKEAIERGATGLHFTADHPFDFKLLLNGIPTDTILIYFRFRFLDAAFTTELASHYSSDTLYFQTDILGQLSRTGNWFSSLQEDHKQLEKIVAQVPNAIAIDLSLFENAGATMVQQLAYSVAQGNEYLEHFGASVATQIHFQCSVGSNYFFEIAKLRALRIVWEALLEDRGITNNSTHILSTPTLRNKTLYDYNVNMLRTTSEAMSAILGGSNAVSNLAYDTAYHKSNEFGERIARNQLLILQQESYLSNAQEVANGTYYIEQLTHQLATKALALFKQLEKGGGYLAQLKKGSIQEKINDAAQQEQERFNNNEIELLGSNSVPNTEDRMKDTLELYPFLKKNHSKTLLTPILTKRLTEAYEQERLANEN